jgi:hypothetical protein
MNLVIGHGSGADRLERFCAHIFTQKLTLLTILTS